MHTDQDAHRFGFLWGRAYVIRCMEDDKAGWWLEVGHLESKRYREIRISKKGLKISVGPLMKYRRRKDGGWRQVTIKPTRRTR